MNRTRGWGAVAVLLAVLAAAIGVQATPAGAEPGDPVGAFDTISARLSSVPIEDPEHPYSEWEIYGWAADPDAPGQPTDIHLYIDGQQDSEPLRTGDPRPDVDAAIPFAGPNAGWHMRLYTLDRAPHTVCVYAINVGPGVNNTTLGCRTYPIAGTSIADPQGNLEAITTTPGFVRFQGWAGDGDAPGATPVRVVEDGQRWEPTDPTLDRPDVHAALPAFHNALGFDISLPIEPGPHIFCVDLGNGGANGFANTSLGCTLVTIGDVVAPTGNEARGVLESLKLVQWPESEASGWAWDPKTSDAATVRLYEVKAGQLFLRTVFTEDVVTDVDRPDVASANPGAPPNTGFRQDVYESEFPITAIHYVCAVVLDGAAQRFIGCREKSYDPPS